MIWHKYLHQAVLFSIVINSDIWPLTFALKSRAVRLGDFYNQLQVNSHVWKAGYADTCQSIVITANSLCVLFSKLKSPVICLKCSLKLTIIFYINLIKSVINRKNSRINISCTVIFLRNEISFRNKSQWLSACQNISYQFSEHRLISMKYYPGI